MTYSLKLAATGSADAVAEIAVGLRSAPYLADHGFQDMVVLPGSFYVEVALSVERELTKKDATWVRAATFMNPVILSSEDTVIEVGVAEVEDGREYSFWEAGGQDGAGAPRYAAKLVVGRAGSPSRARNADGFSIETFQARAESVLDPRDFYLELRQNGNQYGPSFQRISSIWRAGDQSLAQLDGAAHASARHRLHASLLDSMTQLLAPPMAANGRTFILQSIDRIEILSPNLADTLWGHGELVVGDGDGPRGHVQVFDSAGNPLLRLRGIQFALLEAQGRDRPPATKLVVASNFTAEPIEDTLDFWGSHFGAAFEVEFAPYNQVFQQLLDPGSALRRNSDGANVILVRLEEWMSADRYRLARLDKEQADRLFGSRARYLLPNGIEIAHLNKYETEYLYQEIFGDRAYLRHGIELRDGDTVVDIGANIGMFSLFVMSQRANLTVYAFEPAPLTHDALQANLAAYGANAKAFRLGVSDRKKSATFTFYEKSSVFSSFHSDEEEDRGAIEAVVRNMLRDQALPEEEMEAYVAELTADRLNAREYECQLTSLSDVIREQGIERIDLLKVDAEKSELDILRGIADEDWAKIRQVVLEIHDRTGEAVRQTEALLVSYGFHCAVVEETLLEQSGLYNLYATRDPMRVQASSPAPDGMQAVKRNVDDFAAALRAFMQGNATPMILGVAPCSPKAEADTALREALADTERSLLAIAGAIPGVRCLASESLRSQYALGDVYDPHAHQTAHIPYTADGYAALGTAVVRALYTARRAPYKVIVLDCDNTLWGGVVGEDGAAGVQVTAGHRALQEFMLQRMRAGMLLCLCSKNNEQDVFDALERPDMPLEREHLAAWQVNWKSKAMNIQALARQLNLGLDSFLFLDDNPVECAEVRANCPDVTALQVPSDPARFPTFLANVWALDHAGGTQEDAARTRMYQENALREQAREESLSLADFVQGLELRVEIASPAPADIPRVSQLTYRTNQFNFTTIRRSEAEIQEFLKKDGHGGLTVRVSDRFGSYGLVGVVLYELTADQLRVDTLLLSCRVLGRGVEHEIMAWLGKEAVRTGKRAVVVPFAPTARNQPALEFINAVADGYGDASGISWTIPADVAAHVQYDPDRAAAAMELATESESPKRRPPRRAGFGAGRLNEQLQRIADELTDASKITAAIADHRARSQAAAATAAVGSTNSLEAKIASIWSRVLGRPSVGLHDNFFDVGGTSLRAVQVIAAIKKELQQNMTIVALFESPTVAALAARFGAANGERRPEAAAVAAAARGQQRRYNTKRPKTR